METSLVKDTIYWLFFIGIVLMSNFITSREAQNLFRQTLIKSLKLVMIIEFIVNSYTFSLLGELGELFFSTNSGVYCCYGYNR